MEFPASQLRHKLPHQHCRSEEELDAIRKRREEEKNKITV
jgi:hypothetical protein